MLRERVAEDIFVFTSDLYLQATASAILTPDGVVVIDTLPFPQETREMLRFIRRRSQAPIRYVVLTHYQPDHSYGACFLEGEVIAHERCRRILARHGERLLEDDRMQNPELCDVRIRLPETVFDRGTVALHVGGKTIVLMHTPGNTSDGISAYVREDRVLFAGDLVMPVPYIVNGDHKVMRESLRKLSRLQLDNLVQGHGDVLLRGEIPEAIETSIQYLDTIEEEVRRRVERGIPKANLRRLGIERCHKSRIPLNGLAEELHQANLSHLYDVMLRESA
ncbi:MAG: MBL fold metallo-hydrolase [Anaerolineae bacterium]|nr:MBL fold metallo-hydrolase [Anaerolineae bacterium]